MEQREFRDLHVAPCRILAFTLLTP